VNIGLTLDFTCHCKTLPSIETDLMEVAVARLSYDWSLKLFTIFALQSVVFAVVFAVLSSGAVILTLNVILLVSPPRFLAS
jgi:hypothetical protein